MTARKNKQSGLSLVEFTIVAAVLFTVLFAIIEVGVFAYSMQSLNDITRRAARLAAVCQVKDSANVVDLALSEGAPSGFASSNLIIEYLDEDGAKVADPPEDHYIDIRYVKAKVKDYNYTFLGLLGFLGDSGAISSPEFETTLPAESLGIMRPGSSDPDNKTDC
ncbi:pilus assembly protein [Vibrio fluvialis]|nr:pilus assembly protein [Vibrio fluvialis]